MHSSASLVLSLSQTKVLMKLRPRLDSEHLFHRAINELGSHNSSSLTKNLKSHLHLNKIFFCLSCAFFGFLFSDMSKSAKHPIEVDIHVCIRACIPQTYRLVKEMWL